MKHQLSQNGFAIEAVSYYPPDRAGEIEQEVGYTSFSRAKVRAANFENKCLAFN